MSKMDVTEKYGSGREGRVGGRHEASEGRECGSFTFPERRKAPANIGQAGNHVSKIHMCA